MTRTNKKFRKNKERTKKKMYKRNKREHKTKKQNRPNSRKVQNNFKMKILIKPYPIPKYGIKTKTTKNLTLKNGKKNIHSKMNKVQLQRKS